MNLAREVMFRDGVDPLRFAVLASRKPSVAIHGHPFDVYVSPLGPAGKASRLCTTRPITARPPWILARRCWCGARHNSFMLEASHRVHIDELSGAIGIANQCAFNNKAKPLVQANGWFVIGIDLQFQSQKVQPLVR
jgi:hypothetical protein